MKCTFTKVESYIILDFVNLNLNDDKMVKFNIYVIKQSECEVS